MDDVQEGQIKKKKRLMLLMLLALLVVTAGAAALLEPPAPASVAALETSPSPPKQAVTPVAATFTVTPAPSPVQGDEWTRPTLHPATPLPVDNIENDNTAGYPGFTATAASQPEAQTEPTRAQPGPPSSPTSEQATPEFEINPTELPPSPVSPSITEASPSINPVESNKSLTPTPVPQSEAPFTSGKATLIPTEISKRINESWDILDGSYISTAEAVNPSLPLTTTTSLSATTTLSETMAMVPPAGLPVTGVIFQRGMNWTAVVVLVLLLGAGAAALLYPQTDQKWI